MNQFESKKKNFSTINPSRRPAKLRLKMPDLRPENINPAEYDSRYDDVILSQEDIRTCFDPVVQSILDLVPNQVHAVRRNGFPPIETLVLIGGLGSSPYIRERLKDFCNERNIRLTTPWNGG
jgi:tRNA A37 threonylcarbamoyltransferase TsaD